MSQIIQNWKKFWFGPISPYPLCIFRIAFGLVMLVNLIGQYLPFFSCFYGPNSLVSIESIYAYKWQGMPVFDLISFLPNTEISCMAFLLVAILFSLFLTLGFATKISTIGLFLCILSLNNHNPFVIHGGDNFARLVLMFLIFAPSSRVLSLDCYLSKKKNTGKTEELIEPWAQRMIQIQFSFIYFVNWISKMDSKIWTEGEAVYYATRLQQYFRFDYPVFLDNMVAAKALTWSTLLIELSLFALLWPRKTRYYLIVVGILFHLSLDLFFNLGIFEWFFIITFLLFIEPDGYMKVKERLVYFKESLRGKKKSVNI